MTQFHKDQEIEVRRIIQEPYAGFKERRRWTRAKIVRRTWIGATRDCDRYDTEFPDGTRAVFDAEHVRLTAEGLVDDACTRTGKPLVPSHKIIQDDIP
jgi:hypothetical protein